MNEELCHRDHPCPPERAVDAALNFCLQMDAGGDASLSRALKDGAHGEPVYVDRLDRPAGGYYLIPFAGRSGAGALVEVDALTVQVAKAAVVPSSGEIVPLPREKAIEAAVSLEPRLGSNVNVRLAWYPAKECLDSFLPLWLVESGEFRLYVDQSGRAYRRLSLFGHGG